MRVKSWTRIRIQVKIKEPKRAVDISNGGAKAQNEVLEGLKVDQWSQIRITLMKSRIRIHVKGKR